ncbi:mitochondrial assembly of ribosomal large subunit protein 1 [Anarrhichthys ocellatus]|uniref:mitochondrial assembly of ribosomal large subunit protein 1 n=1 Tax=Anarrhichthys ocellatus TaxID=433405 RepID=UPI0012EED740|nr:mitochondrial assembly of ribosomal large subunit protein 1 [Anarrhichthys ocellatus]
MNILNRSKKLVSSVLRSSVLMQKTFVLRNACSVPKARCLNPCLPQSFTARLSSCRHRYHVTSSTQHLETQRLYSEMRGDNSNSKRSTGMSQEEGLDRDNRAPETFTLDVLVSLLRQENAVDVCVIKVPEQIKYTEYFIVVSGVSTRHLRAMALYAIKVYKFLKKNGAPNLKIEGKDAEDWMCIDFGNMVVHFMLPETRDVYELEKLWTLRTYDEQLKNMPTETLPEDFIYDVEVTK